MKRDIYNASERWQAWKETNKNKIPGVRKNNSKLFLEFLGQHELGMNVSSKATKGKRGPNRLLSLKSRLIFFDNNFKKDLVKLSKEEVHKLFDSMQTGKLKKTDGKEYKSVGEYVKDLKCFWNWLLKTKQVKEDITEDLNRKCDKKPDWVYLSEQQFKTFANRCIPDYKALVWLLYDSGARITECYSIRVCDFQNDFSQLTIREDTSKNQFERTINLKLCTQLIKEFISFHGLKDTDYIFNKNPPAFNKYLRTLSKKIFGTGISHPKAKGTYDKFSLYDIRHNSSCYWLARYQSHTKLMYRMAWKSERMIEYYSGFIGQTDKISDEDMIIGVDKTILQKDFQGIKQDVNMLLAAIQSIKPGQLADLQAQIKERYGK